MTAAPAITLEDFHIPLHKADTVNVLNTIEEAVDVMDENNIDQVPVVDDHGDVAMVVTRRAIALVDQVDRTATRIRDFGDDQDNDQNQRVPATTTLTDAMDLLIDHDWVLTIDKDGRPVGLATVGDALRASLDRHGTCCNR